MVTSQKKLQHITGAIIAIVICATAGWAVLAWSAARDSALRKMADCVVATAKAEGYAGNPHGQEAWQLFSGECLIK